MHRCGAPRVCVVLTHMPALRHILPIQLLYIFLLVVLTAFVALINTLGCHASRIILYQEPDSRVAKMQIDLPEGLQGHLGDWGFAFMTAYLLV